MQALKDANQKDKPGLIGQFGVGFYSAYMVADRVTVVSRKATEKSNKAIKWESTADGTYTLDETTRDKPGTDVVLHLRDDDKK